MQDSRLFLAPTDRFAQRHLGSDAQKLTEMTASLGFDSTEDLMKAVIPESKGK